MQDPPDLSREVKGKTIGFGGGARIQKSSPGGAGARNGLGE